MKNEVLVQIGRRLSKARTEKGFTQGDLSDMTGLSIKMISAAENGHTLCDEAAVRTADFGGYGTARAA